MGGLDDRATVPAGRSRPPAWRVPAAVLLAVLLLVVAIVGVLSAVSEIVGNDVVPLPNVFSTSDPAARPAPSGAATFHSDEYWEDDPS